MSQQSSLLRLQEVDLQLMRIRKTLAAMPQQEKLRAIALAKRKVATQLKQIVGVRKDIEIELEDNETDHAKIVATTADVRERVTERIQGKASGEARVRSPRHRGASRQGPSR